MPAEGADTNWIGFDDLLPPHAAKLETGTSSPIGYANGVDNPPYDGLTRALLRADLRALTDLNWPALAA